MKLTKSKLKQIIREELEETMSVASNVLEDALAQTLPVIENAYASLSDDATKAAFEEHLLANVQEYAEKWRAERGETENAERNVRGSFFQLVILGCFPASAAAPPFHHSAQPTLP